MLALLSALLVASVNAQQGTPNARVAPLLTGDRSVTELGSAVTVLDVDSLLHEGPVRTLSELLTGRVPGLVVLPSSGTLGVGSRILMRGVSSYAASSAPQIYVDGVRVNDAPATLTVSVGGQTTSRVDDLNVEDIATITILPGPAATALYGTDAANGVLLVTTRRGAPGAPRLRAFTSQGITAQPLHFPANVSALSATGGYCVPAGVTSGACQLFESNVLMNPAASPFHNGYLRQYGMGVTGGGAGTRYSLAGQWDGFGGVYGLPSGEQERLAAAGGLRPDVMDPNYLRRVNLRGSGQLIASSKAEATVTAGYLWSDLRLPINDNSQTGILANGLLGHADSSVNQGWNAFLPGEIFQVATSQIVRRATASLAGTWRPLPVLTLRANAGLDLVRQRDRQLQRAGEGPAFGTDQQGYVERSVANDHRYTLSLTAAAAYRFSAGLAGRTTAGVQYFKHRLQVADSTGRVLNPGDTTIADALLASLTRVEARFSTVGFLVEQQLAWRDRLFVTAGARHDARDRVGLSEPGVLHPHAGVSWMVPTDAASPVERLRLRAAYGVAGREGIFVGRKPERTRELEGGADATVRGGRVALGATVYDRRTSGITSVVVVLPPSGGSDFIVGDTGVVSNKGIELSLSAEPVRTAGASWHVTVTAWGNRNRVVKVGLVPIVLGQQAVIPGLPIAAYYDRPILGYSDADGDGTISTSEVRVDTARRFLGSAFPTQGATLGTSLAFQRRARVSALLEYRSGNRLWNATEDLRCALSRCRAASDPGASLGDQAAAVADRWYGTSAAFISDARFLKLREIGLTVEAPPGWARRVGAARLTLTVAGRNLATWSSYGGLDPEVNAYGPEDLNIADLFTQPLARYWTARLDLTF